MASDPYTICPICGNELAVNGDCIHCLNEIGDQFFRYLAIALWGGVVISAAVLIPTGLIWRYPATVIALWVALTAIGGALWLLAKEMETR